MGDPTLRTNYIKQPTGLVVTPVTNAGATLSWNASPEPLVIGYYVYRSDSVWGTYSRISPLITATSYPDNQGTNGKKFYLLRPVTLQQTPSGSYYNLGIGITDSAMVSFPVGVPAITKLQQVAIFPNPAAYKLNAIVEGIGPCSARLCMMNATGSIVNTETITLHAGENTFSWDVSAYPSGIYILSVQTANGTVVKKWVKTEGR
jgi:hypothetical protein